MTTIAGCPVAKVMVADSQVSDGDMTWPEHKVIRIGDSLYGAAGLSADCDKFFEYARRGCKGRRPKVDEDFKGLALKPKGLFLYDFNLHPMRMQGAFAIGSGAKPCRALMLVGIDIRRAVEVTCEVDAGSSLPVEVFELEEKQ